MRRAGGAGPAPSHGRLPPTPPPPLSPHPLPPYPRRAAPRRSGRGCAPAARLRRLLASSSRYFCKRPYGRSASCATYLLGAPLFTSARARPPAPRPRCAPCGRCPGLSRSPVPAVPPGPAASPPPCAPSALPSWPAVPHAEPDAALPPARVCPGSRSGAAAARRR